MNRTIRISANDATLNGKFKTGDTVLVLCDSSIAAFTVKLPDARQADNVEFQFKFIDSGSNVVTIQCGVASQFIDTVDSSVSISVQGECLDFRAGNGGWWII